MAASVTYETSNPDQLTLYLQEISDMGLKTISPDINISEIEFSATYDGILFGLQGIKNVGDAALQSILLERSQKPFKDLLDFCKRIDLRSVNSRVIESLICAGAFDGLSGNRAQKMAEVEKIMAIASDHKESQKTGQMGLFGGASSTGSTTHDDFYLFQPLADWTTKEKLEKEKEVAGFYLSSHPLKSYPLIKWLELETFAQGLEKIKKVTSIKEPMLTCVVLIQSYKII